MLDLAWVPLVGAAVMTKKTWDTIPPEGRDTVRKTAAATGTLLKADGRRESAESIEAMRKRGLQVHTLTPDVEAEWRREAEAAYPKIRGAVVPADIFDEVVTAVENLPRRARRARNERRERGDAPDPATARPTAGALAAGRRGSPRRARAGRLGARAAWGDCPAQSVPHRHRRRDRLPTTPDAAHRAAGRGAGGARRPPAHALDLDRFSQRKGPAMLARVFSSALRRASASFSAWQRRSSCRRNEKPARFWPTGFRCGPSRRSCP